MKTKALLYQVVSLVVLTISSLLAHAGEEQYVKSVTGTDIAVGASVITHEDAQYLFMQSNTQWANTFTNHQVKNTLSLRLNRNTLLGSDAFSTKVEGIITYQKEDFSSHTEPFSLEVSYDPASNVTHTDEAMHVFSTGHWVDIEITSIVDPATGNSGQVEHLILESTIDIERYYVFDYTAVPTGLSNQISPLTNNEIEISWPFLAGAEEYELEWVFINSYDGQGGTLPQSQLTYDFKHNSTRIQTDKNYWRISPLFEQGYILYRVRGVGKNKNDFKTRQEGVWSAPDEGTVGAISDKLLVSNPLQSDQMNWSYQVTYTECGKKFEVISYSDGLGYSRQSQTRNNTEQMAVVQEIYYDHQGRPGVASLPTPVNDNLLNYKPNFNQNQSGNHYNRTDFDLDGTDCISPTAPMNDQSGAGQYYSANNPHQEGAQAYVPDAGNYPLVRTEYTPDNTGRIQRQGAAGEDFQLGQGHETKMQYGVPTQQRLNQLFGTDAGWADKYQRNVITDANGQKSISYVDPTGRVVATALAGAAPASLSAIEGNAGPQLITDQMLSPGVQQDIVNNPALNQGSISFDQTVNIDQEADYEFSYSITPQQLNNACLPAGFCFDCVYDLHIEILEHECQQVIFTKTDVIGSFPLDPNCTGAPVPYTYDATSAQPSFHTLLKEGQYTITKVLTVNQQAIDYYTNQYMENSNCLLTYSDFYNQILSNTDFSGCGAAPCEIACLDQLGTEADFIASGAGDALAYAAALQSCINNCETQHHNPCQKYERALRMDFMPGGQYATYTIDANGVYSSSDPLSIFNPNNQLNNGNVNWRNFTYYEADQTTLAKIYNSQGQLVTPTHLSVNLNEFVDQFEYSWTASLINEHPEKCYLDYCQSQANSHQFDADMLNTPNYTDANAASYLNPLGMNNAPAGINGALTDPYFATGGGAANAADMANSLTSFATLHGVNLNIWQVAYLMTFCPSNLNNTADVNNCLAGYNNFNLNNCNDNRYWIHFRKLYLQAKDQIYQQNQTAYAIANGCYNGCIGTGTNYNPALDGFLAAGGPTQPGQPCNNVKAPLYANVQARFPQYAYHPFAGLSGAAFSNQLNNTTQAQLNSHCQSSCQAQAQTWMNELAACSANANFSWTPGDAGYEALKAELIELCTLGCDATNPNGAITLPAGVTTTNGHSNFNDILTVHIGAVDNTCSSLLISSSQPHQATPPEVSTLDECACEKLKATQAQFNTGVLPPGIVTIEELFAAMHGVPVANVEGLLCECDAALNTIPATWAPGFDWSPLQSYFATSNLSPVPPAVGCANCISCSQFKDAYDDFLLRYPNIENHPNYETYLQNHLNNQFGFNLLGEDWAQYVDNCNATMDCQPTTFGVQLVDLLQEISLTNNLNTPIPVNAALPLTSFQAYPVGSLIYQHFGAQAVVYTTNVTNNSITFVLGRAPELCQVTLTAPQGTTVNWNQLTQLTQISVLGNADCDTQTSNFKVTGWFGSTPIELAVSSSCNNAIHCTCGQICDVVDTEIATINPCINELLTTVAANADYAYQQYLQAQEAEFRAQYISHCLEAASTETLSRQHRDYEYHFTLFYYDQAGNLVQTVPPAGIDHSFNTSLVDHNRAIGTHNAPQHQYTTNYRYNSFNQKVAVNTPDAGITHIWYDYAGRGVLVQNAKQANAGTQQYYTYTQFDQFGRTTETGQVIQSSSNTITEAIVKDPAQLASWIQAGNKAEVTRMYYDQTMHASIAAQFNNGQKNLRLRTSSVAYYDTYNGNDMDYAHATHFSYDHHGNVIETIQDQPKLKHLNQQHKHIEHQYELISGNVTKVAYQKGQVDQYYHRYSYDADNRLDHVYTSDNDKIWDQEAHYHYYQHGPLARTELGDWQVQGQDYAYTINGWIKTINGNLLDAEKEMGHDGLPMAPCLTTANQLHQQFAQDAFAFSLGYYGNGSTNDYQPINTTTAAFYNEIDQLNTGSNHLQNLGNELYNGNIRHMATALMDENEQPINLIASIYNYDQLNRIKRMSAYLGTTYATAINNGGAGTPELGDYGTSYSFDRNGNILNLKRRAHLPAGGTTNDMDDMEYWYYYEQPGGGYGMYNPAAGPVPAGGTPTNRLSHIVDNGNNSNLSAFNDIQAMNPGNYTYTPIGELQADPSEGIKEIQWRWGDSKVSCVKRNMAHNQVEHHYDAFGHRVLKLVKPTQPNGVPIPDPSQWQYTYYLRDASGNVMGVYELKDQLNGTTDQLIQQEVHLYGSKRLGIHQQNKLVASYDHTTQQYITEPIPPPKRIMGNKYYELANHLGNVLSVITDRKLYDAEIATDQNDVPVKLDYETYLSTWSAQTPSNCSTPAQFSINNGKLQIDFPPFVTPCSGNSADYKINTVAGETYTVSLKAERGVATDVIAIETRDHINNTVIPTAVWGINIQPGVMEPCIEFTFTATSSETRLKIFSRSAGFTTPTVLYIDEMQILAFERIVVDVVSFSDYYPGGMLMPGRNQSSESYRYGMNGMEKDNELKGLGNSYTTYHRGYDPRTLRWWSVDPVTHPHMSPYNAFDNNPIYWADPSGADGEDPKTKGESGHKFESNQSTDDFVRLEELADKYAITGEAKPAKTRGMADYFLAQEESMDDMFNRNIQFNTLNGRRWKNEWEHSRLDDYAGNLSDFIGKGGMALAAVGVAASVLPALIEGGTILVAEAPAVLAEGYTAVSAEVSELSTFLYYEGNMITTNVVNTMGETWIGRLTLTGGSMYTGSNLYQLGTRPPNRISIFGSNNGYGWFGKKGLNIGNYKIEAFYANTNAGPKAGTYFSIKQQVDGGNMLRLDQGPLHNGGFGKHWTWRCTLGDKTYGSSAQRYFWKPWEKIPKNRNNGN